MRAESMRSFGNAQHVLPHQEDAEAVHEEGHDQALIAVRPVQLLDDQEQRHHGHFQRQHHGAQDQDEHDAPAPVVKLGQAVSGQRAQQQVAERDGHRDEAAVEEVAGEVLRLPGQNVGAPVQRVGNPLDRNAEHVLHRPQRRREHPVEGQQRDAGHAEQYAERGDVTAAAHRPPRPILAAASSRDRAAARGQFGSTRSSLLVPAREHAHLDEREQHHADEQEDAHRGGAPHVEELERRLVDEERQHPRSSRRARRPS